MKYKPLFDLLFWPLLICLGVVSLIAVVRWYFSVDMAAIAAGDLDAGQLVAALLSQAAIQFVVVFAWRANLKRHGLLHVSFLQSVTMIGINSIGKYTPGKIWGLVARGAALLKISASRQLVVSATVVDQVALMHSGAAIAVIAWLYRERQTVLATVCLVLALLSVLIVSRSAGLVVHLKKFLDRNKPDSEAFTAVGFAESYKLVFTLTTLVWLLSGCVLHFCIEAYTGAGSVAFTEILLITVLAYLAGFMAFFSLAGLGVREGVMVAMLGAHMALPVAVYISVVHRLVTLVLDLAIGLTAFLLSRAALNKVEQA